MNVPARLAKDVADMRAQATLPPATSHHRHRKPPAATSSEPALDMSAPVNILLASLPTTEETKNAVRAMHDDLHAQAHSELLARRQGAIDHEMRSIFRAVLKHCDKSLGNGVVPKPLQRPLATCSAPTLKEMMELLHDERAHFDLTGSKDFEKAIASQLQWLMNEMTNAREQATTLTMQYNMLLSRYAKTEETYLKEKERSRVLQGKYEDHVRASTSQQEQNDQVIKDLNAQLQAMRQKVRQAALDVAASKLSAPPMRKGAGAKPVLAPLRAVPAPSVDDVSGVAAAEMMGSARHVVAGTPPASSRLELPAPESVRVQHSHRSSQHVDRSSTKSPVDSLSQSHMSAHRPTTSQSHLADNSFDDERSQYVTAIMSLNQQVEQLTARATELEENLIETEKRLERQKESTTQAVQAGQLESKMIRSALGQVKEVHRGEIEQFKKKVEEREAEIQNQKKICDQLHDRLKESAAKMLSLQQLLLSGPSVQTLLVGAVQPEQVEQTAECIEELSERISAFSSHFSEISAADFGTAAQADATLLDAPPKKHSRSRSRQLVASGTQTEEVSGESSFLLGDRKPTRSPLLADDDGPAEEEEHPLTYVPTAALHEAPEMSGNFECPDESGAPAATETPTATEEEHNLAASAARLPAAASIVVPTSISKPGKESPEASSPIGRKKSQVTLKPPQSPVTKGKKGNTPAKKAVGKAGGVNSRAASSKDLKSPTKAVEGVPFAETSDNDDAEDDDEGMSPEEYARREKEAMARAMSKARSSSFLLDGVQLMGEEAQREIANNMERQAALRKQLTQLLDQLEASRHETAEERKAKVAALEELELERQRRSKDDERIQNLKSAAKEDKNKIESLSLRVGQQLGENSRLIDELHGLRDARETDRENFEKEIAELRAKIAKLQESEQREAMLRKERQFVELCERAIRAMVSAEATASCPNCLTRLTNPVTLVPCGHNFCEVCFFEMQQEAKGQLSPDVADAMGRWKKYREDMEAHSRDPDQFRAPKQISGFFTKSGYAKCVPNCPLYCSDCKARTAVEYVTSFRLDELSEKIAYVSNVVGEIQALSMQRYCDEAGTAVGGGAGRHFVMHDTSAMSTLNLGVDLERPESFYE